MKKVIYVFHSNRNSFDMIFITTYQPKIHKSNGLPKICFHRFYFNLIQDGYVGKGGGGGKKGPPTRFSPVISTNIRLSLQNFLTFSFNSFDRLVWNFKILPSLTPKLLNLNQNHPSKKWFFWPNPYKIEVVINSLIQMLE